jgi:hypothetical protein
MCVIPFIFLQGIWCVFSFSRNVVAASILFCPIVLSFSYAEDIRTDEKAGTSKQNRDSGSGHGIEEGQLKPWKELFPTWMNNWSDYVWAGAADPSSEADQWFMQWIPSIDSLGSRAFEFVECKNLISKFLGSWSGIRQFQSRFESQLNLRSERNMVHIETVWSCHIWQEIAILNIQPNPSVFRSDIGWVWSELSVLSDRASRSSLRRDLITIHQQPSGAPGKAWSSIWLLKLTKQLQRSHDPTG